MTVTAGASAGGCVEVGDGPGAGAHATSAAASSSQRLTAAPLTG